MTSELKKNAARYIAYRDAVISHLGENITIQEFDNDIDSLIAAKLKIKVQQAINTAVFENGYSFDCSTANEIAGDLINFSAEFEDYEVEELLPFAEEWKQNNPGR